MPHIKKISMLVLVVVALGAIGLLAQGQSRPGEMTQAKVWVQNRSSNEAIPVLVQQERLVPPLRVQIDQSNLNPGSVPVRATRQSWEYRLAQIQAADDATVFNNPLGLEGWEAVGVVQSSPSGATILFKRPR